MEISEERWVQPMEGHAKPRVAQKCKLNVELQEYIEYDTLRNEKVREDKLTMRCESSARKCLRRLDRENVEKPQKMELMVN